MDKKWLTALYERLDLKWSEGDPDQDIEAAWDYGWDAGYEQAREEVAGMTRKELKEWIGEGA